RRYTSRRYTGRRYTRRWIDLILVAVLVADLLPRARPLLATAPFRTDVVPWSREIGTFGKVLRFGQPEAGQRALWIAGYLNLYERRFDAFTAAPLSSAAYVRLYREVLSKPTVAAFANAGVVHILTRYALPAPWFPVEQHGGVYAFRNLEAIPMAAHFAPGSPVVRRARWELDTRHARITVNAPADGVVVLRQQAARGWRVTVDGVPAEPLVIDGLFRGVDVKKGRHEIVWTYDPPSFRIGAGMTLVTLLAMQIAVFVKWSRARAKKKNFSSGPSNSE
ncbi:MAG TPA: YfhO family protein, partial [Thermoanaerobaculia bacterium]|nr:YfhO family protein [Thermoanaerobaculia bacterium]